MKKQKTDYYFGHEDGKGCYIVKRMNARDFSRRFYWPCWLVAWAYKLYKMGC